MDATYKLKLKIGTNEFEAEGPPEAVQAQFEAFKQLILDAAKLAPLASTLAPGLSGAGHVTNPITPAPSIDDTGLTKIMRVDNRIVSLTVRARTIDDAVLLLIYGQKTLRNNDAVTGAEVMDGLTATGQRIERVDRVLTKAGEIGDVIVVGVGRAKRYRISNTGLTKAKQLAADLIATVA